MFDDNNEQDDFFAETGSDFSQQDFDNGSADFFDGSQNDFFESSEQFQPQESPDFEQPAVQPTTNFGYKTVGVVVAVALIILALIILFLNNIKVVKKPTDTQTQVQQEQQVTTDTTVDATDNPQESQVITQQSSGMVSIPDSTYMDYSGGTIQSQGVVSSLPRYLQDGQVIYCVDLDITLGTSSTTVHYYCGYNVYKQLQVGDILNVEYQQVSDTCFSVSTIYK